MAQANVFLTASMVYDLKGLLKGINTIKKLFKRNIDDIVPNADPSIAELFANISDKYKTIVEESKLDDAAWHRLRSLRIAIKNSRTGKYSKFVLPLDEASFIYNTITKFNELFTYISDSAKPFAEQIRTESAKIDEIMSRSPELLSLKFYSVFFPNTYNAKFITRIDDISGYWLDIYSADFNLFKDAIDAAEANTQWITVITVDGDNVKDLKTICTKAKPITDTLPRVISNIFNEHGMSVSIDPEVEVIADEEDSVVYKFKALSLETEAGEDDDDYEVIFTSKRTPVSDFL